MLAQRLQNTMKGIIKLIGGGSGGEVRLPREPLGQFFLPHATP